MDYDEIKTLRNPGKWCHYMVNVGYMIAGLIIFAHVIWFFAASSILAHPPEIYLRDYIILPAIGLFALVGLADVLVRSKHTSVFAKEWIALSLFTVIAAYLCLSHDIARVLLASFMLSIFTSTIFSDVKLSRLMFAESIVSLLLIGGVLYFSGQMNDDLIMQIFVACFMCACAYLLSRIMVLHGRANLSALIKYNIEQHNMQEQMKLDTFTELYNRKTFDAYLCKSIGECQRRKVFLTLAMIDIDDFKAINDCYGHAMGDRVLLHFSNSLKAIQTDDVRAFRMGGDEFSILFKGCDSEEASRICETLRAHLQSFPKRVKDEKPLTFSCGIVSVNPISMDTKSFVESADKALYTAKSHGKDQIAASMINIHTAV